MRKLLLIATGLLGLALQAQAADKKLPFKGDIGMTYSQVIKAQGEPGEASDRVYKYGNIKWQEFIGELHYWFARDGKVIFIVYVPKNVNEGRVLENLKTLYIPVKSEVILKGLNEDLVKGVINEVEFNKAKEDFESGGRAIFHYKKYRALYGVGSVTSSGKKYPYIEYDDLK
jgi:hypothetical protein